jgi:NAD(P)-dependent dehydrogenase (short-subunit alcohol dehydrogenase family)
MLDMKTAVAEKFGGVDILINCAGVIFAGCTETTFP